MSRDRKVSYIADEEFAISKSVSRPIQEGLEVVKEAPFYTEIGEVQE